MGGWKMLEEVERMKQEELSCKIDEVSCNIKGNEESCYNSLNIEKIEEQNKSRSLFGAQLLFCSILLWSLLFIKDSAYGKVYLSAITEILTKNIEIEPVQQVVNQLTITIQELI